MLRGGKRYISPAQKTPIRTAVRISSNGQDFPDSGIHFDYALGAVITSLVPATGDASGGHSIVVRQVLPVLSRCCVVRCGSFLLRAKISKRVLLIAALIAIAQLRFEFLASVVDAVEAGRWTSTIIIENEGEEEKGGPAAGRRAPGRQEIHLAGR